MGVALALIHIVKGSPIRVSYIVLYKRLIHCNSCYKQLCLSNKMEHFSYKGGCGIREITHIKVFKRS